uniref:Ig-like domain-containing protein n=1 Tax=Serinus canaria TaxID=9135 RepID=A0A8C9MYC6_SERCA
MTQCERQPGRHQELQVLLLVPHLSPSVLSQNSRGMTVQEGNEVTFQCSMNGGDMSYYIMYWYRQGPRGMEWISRETSRYGEGFQDRFKGRKDSSQNSYTLQILAAQQVDAATYYCQAAVSVALFLS